MRILAGYDQGLEFPWSRRPHLLSTQAGGECDTDQGGAHRGFEYVSFCHANYLNYNSAS
jgi:hypothetical protein